MASGDIVKILSYLERIENPLVIAISAILIVFLLLRRFTTSEYVTAGKEAMASLKELYDKLHEAHEELKKEYEALKAEFEECKREFDELKARITRADEETI